MIDINMIMKQFGEARTVVESKNFYFDMHQCLKSGEPRKVMFDYSLRDEESGDCVRFGICQECKTLVFHNHFK